MKGQVSAAMENGFTTQLTNRVTPTPRQRSLALLSAAIAVTFQLGWRMVHPEVPIVETMGAASIPNLAANIFCHYLLSAHKNGDLNMSSAWECARNES
jgi:Co/Zn/Cd efflux system component